MRTHNAALISISADSNVFVANTTRAWSARLFANMTSSTNPEIHNISQRRRKEDRATAMGNTHRETGEV